MELYPFNALLARMKYIARWGLMRAARTESLSEHTADAAILAHTLCLVSQTIFGTDVRPETVAVAALYHDASEILTGDMPTPVKYKSEPLRAAYKAVEADAAHTLGALLPDAVRAGMDGYLSGGILTQKERQLLKAADRALRTHQMRRGGKRGQPGICRCARSADGGAGRHGMPGGGLLHAAYAALL